MECPVGPLVASQPASSPSRVTLNGRYTTLKPLESSHSAALYRQLGGERNFSRWTYMFTSGWSCQEQCEAEVNSWVESKEARYFTVFSGPDSEATAEPVGVMSYLNIVPAHRRIEIGSIIFSQQLQQTRAATEAFYLLVKHAFEDLSNYRVEWKANNLNKPSLSAAERLGFVFEGVFRKHMVIKGRQRDTAWYSITDDEWPTVKNGFEAWLDETNFDTNGNQIRGLRQCRDASAS